MTETIDLKELERKAYRSTFQDGIWDIFLGMLLIGMGVNAYLSHRAFSEPVVLGIYGAIVLSAVGMMILGKRRITVPRLGYVKFNRERNERLSAVRIVLLLSAVFGVIVFALTMAVFNGTFPGISDPHLLVILIWVANSLIVFSFMAHYMNFPRLYLIGVLFALVVPVDATITELFAVDVSYLVFAGAGAIIVTMGMVFLRRFLREYPLPVEGYDDAER